MSRYPLNQPIRQSTTTKQLNLDGTYSLANATMLTLVVQKPDASQQTYSSPANDGAGLYHQDIPVADLQQLGHYQLVWTSTGTAAGVSFGDFDVFDPFETAVLSLQDAKDALNIPQASTAQDAEIQQYIATIGTSLEGITGGPLVNRTVTSERCEFTGWYQMLQVRQRPLVSVTSITSVASGTAIDISGGLDISPAARTIRKKDRSPFSSDSPVVLVTYTAGWGTAVPAAIGIAARIIIQHLWDTQRGPLAMPMAGEQLVQVPGFGFAIPSRAAELLQGTLNGIPFADAVFAW